MGKNCPKFEVKQYRFCGQREAGVSISKTFCGRHILKIPYDILADLPASTFGVLGVGDSEDAHG